MLGLSVPTIRCRLVFGTQSSLGSFPYLGGSLGLAHGKRLGDWCPAGTVHSLGLAWTSARLCGLQPSAEQNHLRQRTVLRGRYSVFKLAQVLRSIHLLKAGHAPGAAGAARPPVGGSFAGQRHGEASLARLGHRLWPRVFTSVEENLCLPVPFESQPQHLSMDMIKIKQTAPVSLHVLDC